MNYYEFFTTDNKSGHKLKENYLKSSYPKIYNEVINFINQNKIKSTTSFSEKVYLFIHNITMQPKCEGCNNYVKYKGLKKGYSKFCSIECANNNGDLIQKQKKVMRQKYGVDFYTQHDEFVSKSKQTKKNKYGNENFNNLTKILSTKNKKYNDPYFNNSDQAKYTNIKKYGVYNPSLSNEIKAKIEESNIEKIGVKYPTQSQEVKKKIKEKNDQKLKEKFPFIKEVYNSEFYCFCKNCNSYFTIPRVLLNERYRIGYGLCINCNPIGEFNKSIYEDEICNFLEYYKLNVEKNNRILLDGKEIDIYLPDYKIGIEFNGLYFHNELFKNKNYHLNKTKHSENNGIQLIQIFEDEWIYKKEIVKSLILNKLGLTNNKIYARNCDIKEINTKQAKQFLHDNHLQGYVNCSIKIGLFNDNELVSILTFNSKNESFELSRFCVKKYYNIIGGFSKLLKYFKSNYSFNKIYSFSDLRYSNGDLYKKNGFEYVHDTKPNYFYVIGKERWHRFNFRKDKLVREGYDKNKSESTIMKERNIYKIYDCGHQKWQII